MKMLTYLSKEKKLSFANKHSSKIEIPHHFRDRQHTCPKRNAPAESDIVNLVEAHAAGMYKTSRGRCPRRSLISIESCKQIPIVRNCPFPNWHARRS